MLGIFMPDIIAERAILTHHSKSVFLCSSRSEDWLMHSFKLSWKINITFPVDYFFFLLSKALAKIDDTTSNCQNLLELINNGNDFICASARSTPFRAQVVLLSRKLMIHYLTPCLPFFIGYLPSSISYLFYGHFSLIPQLFVNYSSAVFCQIPLSINLWDLSTAIHLIWKCLTTDTESHLPSCRGLKMNVVMGGCTRL